MDNNTPSDNDPTSNSPLSDSPTVKKERVSVKRSLAIIVTLSIAVLLGGVILMQSINMTALKNSHQKEVEEIKETNRVELRGQLLEQLPTTITLGDETLGLGGAQCVDSEKRR